MTRVSDPNNISLESLVEFTRTGVALDLEQLDKFGDVTAEGVLIPGLFNDTPYLTYGSCILNAPIVNIQNQKSCKECSPDPNALVPDWKALQDGDIYFNERTCTYEIVKNCYRLSVNGRLSKKQPIIGYPTDKEIDNLKEFAIAEMLKEFAKTDAMTAVIFVPDNFGVMSNDNLQETKGTDYFRQLIQGAQTANPGSLADAILLSGYYDDENTKRRIPPPIKNFTRVVQEIDVVQELKKYLKSQVYVNISEAVPTKILFSIESRLLEIIPQLLVSTPIVPANLYTESGTEVTITGRDFDRIFNRGARSLVRAGNFVDNLVVNEQSMFYIRGDDTGNNDVPFALDTRMYAERLKEFKRSLLFAIKRMIGIRIRELDKVIISFDSGSGQAETEDEEVLYRESKGNILPTPPKIRIKNIIGNKYGCPDVVIYDRDEELYRTKTDINEIFDSMRDSTLNGYISSLPEVVGTLEGKPDINWIDFILTYTYPGLIVKDRIINAGDELSKCINTKSLNGLVNDLVSELIEFPNLFLNSVTESVCSTKEQVLDEETNIERTRRQIREQLIALVNQSELLKDNQALAALASNNPEIDYDKFKSIAIDLKSPSTLDDLRKLSSGQRNRNITLLSEQALQEMLRISTNNDDTNNKKRQSYEKYQKTIQEYEKSLRMTQGKPIENTTVPPTTKTTDLSAIEKAKKEIEAVNRAIELVKQYQSTTTKEIIKDKFLSSSIKSLQLAQAETSNKPMVNMIVQLILGAIAGEESGLGATLSTQTAVDTKFATKKHNSGPKAGKAKRLPLIENAGNNKLASLLNNLNSGGGWCAWVAMIQEAAQCILKGLGLTDAKSAIIKAALKKLTPFEWQKMFRNMPPQIRGRIYEQISKSLPDLVGVLFPWQDNLGTGTFRPDLALEDARQQILRNAVFYNPKKPSPPSVAPPVAAIQPATFSVPVAYYDVAKYELKDLEKNKIDNFVDFIVKNELAFTNSGTGSVNQKIEVNVFGHASTTATATTNQKLSENRAKSVSDYLKTILETKKVQITINTKSFGETLPLDIGSQQSGSLAIRDEHESPTNRRTEIFVTFKAKVEELSEKAKSAALGIIQTQNAYNELYEKNAAVYDRQNLAAVTAVAEIADQSINLGTKIAELVQTPDPQKPPPDLYYQGSDVYPDSVYPGSQLGPDGNPIGNPDGYLNEYLAAGYGEEGLTLFADPNDPNGYRRVTPPPVATRNNRNEVVHDIFQITEEQRKAYGENTTIQESQPIPPGLSKNDIAYNIMINEANFFNGGWDPTDIAGNQKKISDLMKLSDQELINRGSQSLARNMRQEFINKRLAAGAGAKFSGALAEITSEAINIIIDIFIDLVGVDILLEEINNLPGIGIAKKIIKDIQCIIPPMPYMSPTIENYIKSIRFDLCYIGQKGYKATSIMSTPPMIYGDKLGRPLHLKGWGRRARKILLMISMKAADLLLDLLTQILIKALVKVIETILDLTCSLVAEAAANLASMATKNSNFLTRLKNAICPDTDINDEIFGEGLANVLEALYPPSSPESSCAVALTGPELAAFIDGIVVTLSYGQLYDLILGNPSEETLKIVSSIANAQGDCISQIFGDTTNILNYFAGLGKLIGAQDVFNDFPANVNLTPNATICPPNTFQTLRDLRKNLLEDKGLTPEQVQEQLDFLQNEALKKLEDLTRMLNEGPFGSLEDMALANQGCTFNGIIEDDPYARNMRNNIIESIISPIEHAVMRDMIGQDGAINMILADTNGADLRLHRTRVRDFGNSIGQTNNLPHEYYSDNTIRKSFIDMEENSLTVINDKKQRLDQFGRTMPLAKTDKGPVGGFGPTIGGYLMNKFQTTRIGFVDYGVSTSLSDIKQEKLEFKTKRADISVLAERQRLNDFNNQLLNARIDRLARFCIATGFIDAETAAQHMASQPSQSTYSYTNYIRNYFDYSKRKAVFVDMINAASRAFPITNINYPDYSPEKRFERCLGQPKNPELREFSYSGSSVGLGYTFKEKVRKAYNAGEAEIIVGFQKDQSALTTFSMSSTIPADQRQEILDSMLIKMNREMMEYYLECWYAYNTEAEGINDEERRKHFKPFSVNGIEYTPDAPFKKLPISDSSELALTYITYPKIYGGILGSGKANLAMPEYAFDLKYNLNIEDNNGIISKQYKNMYNVILTERLNPFSDQKLNADQKQSLKEYYNLVMSSPNTKDIAGNDESADLEGSPAISIGSGNREIIKFNKTISSIPDPDVLAKSETLLSNSTQQDIQYSYESEAFMMFLKERLNQSTQLQPILDSFTNTITRNEVNNLFDFINDGLVKRIASSIGEGDGTQTIFEFDDVDSKEYQDYATEKAIKEARVIKVPKGFLFGFDPELSPTVHILDPDRYGGGTDNPPYYIEPPTYNGWMGLIQKMFPEKDGCEPSRSYISSMPDLREEYQSISNLFANDERLGFDPLCTKEAPYNQIYESSTVAQMDIVIRATVRTYLLEQMLKIVPLLSTFQPNDNNFDELMYIYLADTILDEIKKIDIKRPFPERGPKVIRGEDGKVFLLNEISRRYTYFYGILEQAGYAILKKIEAGLISEDTLGSTQQQAVVRIRESIDSYYRNYDGTEAVLSDESIAAQTVLNRAINGVISRKVAPTQGLGGSSFDKLKAKRIKKAAIYQALQQTEQDARTLFSIYLKEEFQKLSKIMTEKLEPSVEGIDLLFLSSPKYVNGAVTKIRDEYNNVVGYSGPYDVMSDTRNSDNFNIDLTKFTVQADSGEFIDRRFPISIDPVQAQEDIKINSKEPWPFVLERYITTDEPTLGKIQDQNIYNVIFNRDPKLFGNINFNDWDKYIKDLSEANQNFTGNISNFWGKEEGKSGWRWGVRLSLAFTPSSKHYQTFKQIVDSMPEDVLQRQKAFRLVNDSQNPNNYMILIPICFGELDIQDQDLSSFSLDQFDLPCTIMEMIKTTDFRFVTKYLFPQKRYVSLLGIYTANSFFDSIGNAGSPGQGGDRWTIPGGRRNSAFRKWDKGSIFYDPQKVGNDTANVLMNTFMALYKARAEFADHSRQVNRKTLPNIKETLLSLLPDPILPDIPWFQRNNMIPRPYDMFDEECSDNVNDDIDEGEI